MLNNLVGIYGVGTPVSTNSYESIQTVTVGSGGASSIDFTSIPSTFKHLQIRLIARSHRSSTLDAMNLRFNSDSGSNYAHHAVYGDGSSTAAEGVASTTGAKFYRASAANSTSGIFGVTVIDILDYADTNKFKTMRYLGGVDQNGSGEVFLGSGLWRSTSATTSLSITAFVGTGFLQHSQFALYGIKG